MTTTSHAVSESERYEAAKQQLDEMGQAHALKFFDELDEAGRQTLLGQIEAIDWAEVARLIQTHVKAKPGFELPENLTPAPWYPNQPAAEQKPKYDQAWAEGERLLRAGKVAAFTVAGGQGTRLGWAGPKGTFPATPVRELSIFGCFAEYLHNVQNRYQTTVPWYIMTSPANDAQTRGFFTDHDYFGLNPDNVMLFAQAMMPAIDMETGKVLLAGKDSLALSPNGHGGSLKALYTSAALADMNRRGIEQISYTQVDNPIVRVVDPLFLGLHALDQAQMSSKMLPKREPLEKLGNFCLVDGKMTVIEYSNLPEALARQTIERDGREELRFLAGSIAIHLLRVDFVESLNRQGGGRVLGQDAGQARSEGEFALPWNRAEKKVGHLDLETAQWVDPAKPNAVKLETFVFDALPFTDRSVIYETSRPDEFAPIKNASGEGVNDSPQTSKRIQTARAGRWLEECGVSVPRNASDQSVDANIEIKQTTAIYADDVRRLIEMDELSLAPQIAAQSEFLV